MRVSPERTELARMRVAANVRQKELANRCGVTAHHLRMVELGQRTSVALCQRAKEALRK